jgi:hypothetical protein
LVAVSQVPTQKHKKLKIEGNISTLKVNNTSIKEFNGSEVEL